jgi:hypothetical protein
VREPRVYRWEARILAIGGLATFVGAVIHLVQTGGF